MTDAVQFVLEIDQIFCANPHCELHLDPAAPNVAGRGNWATRSDGVMVGRSSYNGRMDCDLCGQVLIKTRVDENGRAACR